MEALTKLGIDFRVLIAQIINFGVLFSVLVIILYRPILNALEARRKRIQESLDKAAELDKKNAATEAEYQEKMAKAKEKIQQLLEDAKREAEAARKEIVALAEAEAARTKAMADSQIEAKKRQLYTEVKHQTGDLALLLMTRAFDYNQSEAFYRKSIDASLREMEAKIT